MWITEKYLFNDVIFQTLNEFYDYITQRCIGKNSLKLVTKERGHLKLRCPLVGDYLDVYGEDWEIEWLHRELSEEHWYKVT